MKLKITDFRPDSDVVVLAVGNLRIVLESRSEDQSPDQKDFLVRVTTDRGKLMHSMNLSSYEDDTVGKTLEFDLNQE